MGLVRRKVSGRTIGGSRLVVDGQPIFSVIKYVPEIKKTRKIENFVEGAEPPVPVTTTTTTQLIVTCNIETQLYEDIVTQDYSKLIWC
jgi:hypothetical protein